MGQPLKGPEWRGLGESLTIPSTPAMPRRLLSPTRPPDGYCPKAQRKNPAVRRTPVCVDHSRPPGLSCCGNPGRPQGTQHRPEVLQNPWRHTHHLGAVGEHGQLRPVDVGLVILGPDALTPPARLGPGTKFRNMQGLVKGGTDSDVPHEGKHQLAHCSLADTQGRRQPPGVVPAKVLVVTDDIHQGAQGIVNHQIKTRTDRRAASPALSSTAAKMARSLAVASGLSTP